MFVIYHIFYFVKSNQFSFKSNQFMLIKTMSFIVLTNIFNFNELRLFTWKIIVGL